MKMNRTNTAGRLLALLLLALMMLSLTACGTKNGDKTDGMSSEPKNAEEAVFPRSPFEGRLALQDGKRTACPPANAAGASAEDCKEARTTVR